MKGFVAAAAAVAFAAVAAPVQAEDTPWQAIARQDAEAALAMIEQNHPGARPEVGDAAFRHRLEIARQHLADRLPKVANYAGYSALMLGLANDFGDGHIRTSGRVSPTRIDWAGLVVERSAGQWRIAADANPGGELKGARLVACDGIAAEQLARDRIGQFRANPAIAADMARSAYLLLLDDGSPFLVRPVSCAFELASGDMVQRALPWRSERTQQVQQALNDAVAVPKAGMGMRKLADGGYWISLETLGERAETVVQQVEAAQADLRAAPFVVIDVRGNGGGNSRYSDRIGEALAGHAAIEALTSGESDCQGEYWRASPDNAAALRGLAGTVELEASRAWIEEAATAIEQAVAAGRAFAPDLPACAARGPVAVPARTLAPPLAMTGKLVLLTDRACFSSCLLAADLFRQLGALHVGEATDLSTRYMEVRDAPLPSGLRTFSTLMKVSLGSGDFGPYEPAVPYPGSMSDTQGLEDWIIRLLGDRGNAS